MEKTQIAALLDALCERPLADGQLDGRADGRADGAAELQAFCREAAKVLSQGADAPAGFGPPAETDRLTAALAALLSGSDVESARRTFEEAMLRSSATRLDAQSALAFVDALERAPRTAPAHLVEELLATDRAAAEAAMAREDAGRSGRRSGLWALIAGASWSARRWRMAAACTILLVGGAASWSTYWQRMTPADGDLAQPMAKTSEPAVSVRAPARAQAPVSAPAPPKPALARSQPCDTRSQVGEAAKAAKAEPGVAGVVAKPAESSADANCAAEPQHADRPTEASEARAARLRAEADRQAAAAARAAAEAASNADAARADRSGPGFGAADHAPPAAAARTAPAATPATRPPAPVGAR